MSESPLSNEPSASRSSPSRRVTSLAWRLTYTLLRIGLLLLIMIAWFQRSLIYHPKKTASLSAAETPLPQAVVDVKVTTHDGLTLHGWLALAGEQKSEAPVDPNRLLSQGRPLVIIFPGNAGHRGYRAHLMHTFGALGADSLIFDYRGYAENPGQPSEAHFVRDARSIWDFATKELGVSARQIFLYGESIGGGSAVRLAGDLGREGVEPGGLIVESSFNSLVAAGRHHFPILPVGLILIDRFDSAQHITRVTCPILLLHGACDRVVPLKLGEKLFESAPAKSSGGIAKQMVILPNADHNDVYDADLPLVVEALNSFLNVASDAK